MKSSVNQSLEELLGKELWGVLSFEMHLPALYQLIDGKRMGIGLNRLADWVLFPHKIPIDYQLEIYKIIEQRHELQVYKECLLLVMTEQQAHLHYLLLELLQLKYAASVVEPKRLVHIYKVPSHMFFALTTQLIEYHYLSSPKSMELFHTFMELREEEVVDDDE